MMIGPLPVSGLASPSPDAAHTMSLADTKRALVPVLRQQTLKYDKSADGLMYFPAML